MTRTMLSLVLLAAFVALTLQSPILLRTSSKIAGLSQNAFMNSSQLSTLLETHYKQHPRDLPKNVYVFNVSIGGNSSSQVLEAVRDMKSNKQIFAGSPNGYVSNYFRYNRSAEVVESVLATLGSIAGQFERNMSTLQAFEKSIYKRAKNSKFGADIIDLPLSDIKTLDRILSRAEKTLADKADGNYIIAIVFDNRTQSMTEEANNRRILQAADNNANANGGNAAAANANAPLAISSNTFTGIIVGLFILAVTLVAMNLLSDIKTPNSFISVPLNIGKEH